MHESSWFVEVVLINLWSCYSHHCQYHRAWMTLLFPVISFILPSMYGSKIILVSVCPLYIISICTLGDFLRWRMVVMPGVIRCYGAGPWQQWPSLGFEVQTVLDQRYQWIPELVSLSGDVSLLLLHHDYICLQYVKWSDMTEDMPSYSFQGVD